MSETALALNSLGSDLAFAVSFAVSAEVLAAADEAQISADETVGIVLIISVLLTALPRSAMIALNEFSRLGVFGPKPKDSSVRETKTGGEQSGLAAFLTLLVSMLQRVLLSVAVQLLSTNVRSKQPLRSVRIVSLLAVAVFFVFISGGSSVGKKS